MVTAQNSTPNSVDEMIDGLEMYVLNRQIGIAEFLAKEFADDNSLSPLKQSGYAILSICMAYFEMIEQFHRGQVSKSNESPEYFAAGFRRVYSTTTFAETDILRIYGWVRCKMYHSGMTHGGVAKGVLQPMDVQITRHQKDITFLCDKNSIFINPAKLVEDVRLHFTDYARTLRDPSCLEERRKFEMYCELIGFNTPIPSSTSQSCLTTQRPWLDGEPRL